MLIYIPLLSNYTQSVPFSSVIFQKAAPITRKRKKLCGLQIALASCVTGLMSAPLSPLIFN